MITTYCFDWFGTVGNVNNEINFLRKTVNKNQHHELLTEKLDKIQSISIEKKDKILEYLNNEDHFIYEGTISTIDNLKSKGYKLAIISNIYDVSAEMIKKRFPNFLDKFDVVTFSAEIGLRKPQPEIFIYTLNRLNVASKEAMMIGDEKDKDYDPAIKLGMQARLIDRTKQTLWDVI